MLMHSYIYTQTNVVVSNKEMNKMTIIRARKQTVCKYCNTNIYEGEIIKIITGDIIHDYCETMYNKTKYSYR
jgi:RNase P subunit RPR2